MGTKGGQCFLTFVDNKTKQTFLRTKEELSDIIKVMTIGGKLIPFFKINGHDVSFDEYDILLDNSDSIRKFVGV